MPHGAPCWFELLTTDLAAAKSFYTRLFGWSIEDTPMPNDGGVYTLFLNGGASAAGAFTMDEDMRSRNVPPHWATFFQATDADALTPRITELGGTVMAEPFDVGPHGRMAIASDPAGAVFRLWQPGEHPGAESMNTENAVLWVELATRDLNQAQKFYGDLLSWEFHEHAPNYRIFKTSGKDRGGFIEMDGKWGGARPHWALYIWVADVHATCNVAPEAGGSVCVPPFEAPGVGWIAGLADPSGAMFYVITPRPPSA